METKNPNEKEINNIIEKAELYTDKLDIFPFSKSAFKTLKEKIESFIQDLISESINVSKRYKSDTISSNHVEHASEYLLVSTRKRIYRHLGTIGGIFLGASISNIISMTSETKFTSIGILISAALGIIGAFLIALQIAKD